MFFNKEKMYRYGSIIISGTAVILLFLLCGCSDAGATTETMLSVKDTAIREEIIEVIEENALDNLPSIIVKYKDSDKVEQFDKSKIQPFITSDESITLKYKYVYREDVMPYGLLTPSTAETNKKTPLIVWLHGSGESGVGESIFNSYGLPPVVKNWKLEGFNAYIVMPHLLGEYNQGTRMNKTSATNVNNLIDQLRQELNIDEERIILCGHSLGGQGAAYIANYYPDLFSCVVPLSGYDCGSKLENINIPIRAYVGSKKSGDGASNSYVTKKFAELRPDAEIFVLESTHGEIPRDVFNLDENGDNKSDIIEWMLNNKREVVGIG